MTFKLSVFAVVCLGGLAAHSLPQKPRVEILEASKEDNVPAETGFANPSAPVHQGSKFFQYIHVPAKDHVEHGHKRGNDHHFIERHEKENPHAGEFKTKRDVSSWYDSNIRSSFEYSDPPQPQYIPVPVPVPVQAGFLPPGQAGFLPPALRPIQPVLPPPLPPVLRSFRVPRRRNIRIFID